MGQVPARRKTDPGTGSSLGVRILAVDDDRSYLRYLELILTRAGFDVTLVPDGETAIRVLKQDERINLLLVDLAMPGMDGLELIARVRELEGSDALYAILLTARSDSDTKLRAFASGFDDFLSKSEPEAEVIAKLRSAARRLSLEVQLQLQNEKLRTLAFTDELTGVSNRRALFRTAEELIRVRRPFAVVMLDLDRFKQINDVYGHAMGDRVLIDAAAALTSKTRVGDVIARYGGDEFVMLLLDVGESETAMIAGRIASAIAALEWTKDGQTIRTRASLGTSMVRESFLETLQECDARLYAMKRRQGPSRRHTAPGLQAQPEARG